MKTTHISIAILILLSSCVTPKKLRLVAEDIKTTVRKEFSRVDSLYNANTQIILQNEINKIEEDFRDIDDDELLRRIKALRTKKPE